MRKSNAKTAWDYNTGVMVNALFQIFHSAFTGNQSGSESPTEVIDDLPFKAEVIDESAGSEVASDIQAFHQTAAVFVGLHTWRLAGCVGS